MNDFIMWFVLFAIIYWFFTRHDRQDRKRWPSLMNTAVVKRESLD